MSALIVPGFRPEPPRDQYGRYLLPDPHTGVARSFTRATTVAHTLSDEYHLTQWKRRKVAEGLARRPDLLEHVEEAALALTSAAGDWRAAKPAKAALDHLCDVAAEAAGANDGSAYGTALHTLTEWLDVGLLDSLVDLLEQDGVKLPEFLIEDLAAYAETMAIEAIDRPVEYVERIVVNSILDSAGTFDRLLRMPDGRLVVGDLKTQKSIDFGFMEIAVQLAEYAYADHMAEPVGPGAYDLVPMPEDLDREVGIVIHLPVGSAKVELYEVDLVAGWNAAQLSAQARIARSRSKAMGRPYLSRRRVASTVGRALEAA